jgi:hypothetical protein
MTKRARDYNVEFTAILKVWLGFIYCSQSFLNWLEPQRLNSQMVSPSFTGPWVWQLAMALRSTYFQ